MEELYKKDLNEPDCYNGVLSHPEPDILECEVGLKKHCCYIKLVDAMKFPKNYSNP